MSENAWNPPTGPPNGVPVRSADARREIDAALDAARARDRTLRADVVAIATARVHASDRLAVATEEAAEARSLAKRALTRSNESARAGQRADAAKWTAAAQVFAMRLRDAREQVKALEMRLATAADQARRTEIALDENVGRLEAVVVSRLPMLSGRKASRAERAVDEVVAAISVPTGDLVAGAAEAARAADQQAAADGGAAAPVSDDDLEHEVDFEGADAILDELRSELGLPVPAASGPPDPAALDQPGPSSPEAGTRGPASAAASKSRGRATSGRSWPAPAARR